MSAAEIADNKWELQASKPPVTSTSGILQLAFMAGFVGVFAWLIVSSIIGIVTPPAEDGGLAGQYQNMSVDGAPKAEAEAE